MARARDDAGSSRRADGDDRPRGRSWRSTGAPLRARFRGAGLLVAVLSLVGCAQDGPGCCCARRGTGATGLWACAPLSARACGRTEREVGAQWSWSPGACAPGPRKEPPGGGLFGLLGANGRRTEGAELGPWRAPRTVARESDTA